MQLKLRIQLNGILSSDLSPPGTNVTFVNKLIPMSWTEIEATIDADTAKEYSSQVNKRIGLLKRSILLRYGAQSKW